MWPKHLRSNAEMYSSVSRHLRRQPRTNCKGHARVMPCSPHLLVDQRLDLPCPVDDGRLKPLDKVLLLCSGLGVGEHLLWDAARSPLGHQVQRSGQGLDGCLLHMRARQR